MPDIPCICGHLKSQHIYLPGNLGFVCVEKYRAKFVSRIWADDCLTYTPDNLSYVETIAKRKKLI